MTLKLLDANSTGLILYNPKNAAEMLKSMKNKNNQEKKNIGTTKYDKQQSQQ